MTKSKLKTIVMIIALVLVAALTAGIIAQSVTISKLKQAQEQLQTTNATDENGNYMDNSTVYELPKAMSFSAMALAANPAGISVNVTASVEPSTATNKAVDWSVMWSDNTNAASVTDYVTVTPASNGQYHRHDNLLSGVQRGYIGCCNNPRGRLYGGLRCFVRRKAYELNAHLCKRKQERRQIRLGRWHYIRFQNQSYKRL